LDTTFILPTFGISVNFATNSEIKYVLQKHINAGNKLYISEISLLEAYLKTISIARKRKLDSLFKKAFKAFFTIKNSQLLRKINYASYNIIKNTTNLLKMHKDPFDAIIMSTAISERMPLVTEDSDIINILPHELVMSWSSFKEIVK